MKEIILASDGSCLGNPGPGGWAAILRYQDHCRELSGGEPHTTNNRMEITAVIRGLAAIREPCSITVRTDSQYVKNAFTNGWLANWKANGWKTADRKPVKNIDLWQQLDLEISRHRIRWEWVRGHNGDPDNERADELARSAALKVSQQEAPG